jgi:inner membrane protein
MRFPLLLRAGVIAAVATAILVPIALIQGKIAERRARANEAIAQFASETSGPQVIAGPFLALTCEETYTEEREIKRGGKAETVSEKKVAACPTAFIAPRTLNVEVGLPVDSRHRGIYPIRLYRAKARITGELAWPAPAAPNGLNPRTWRAAYLVMAVSDARGVREVRSTPPATQGRAEDIDARFTFRSDLGPYAAAKAGEALAFDIALEAIGTSMFGIAPVGDATDIQLKSDWPHPAFTGSWSPDSRTIAASGFEARWRVTHHATGGQAAWERAARENQLFGNVRAAGVTLFDPVNVYSLSYRATEYGFLFVLFTFGALALTEALAGIRLHPMQYLLVGSALAVFFLLLISGSEHVDFGVAYLASAVACVALLTFYLRHPLGTARRAAGFLALFSSMYAALYVLLESEDHALLMGSLLVFGLLAAAMVATRRLDWSALSQRMTGADKPAAAA